MMNKRFANSDEQKHVDKLKTDLIRGDKGKLKEQL